MADVQTMSPGLTPAATDQLNIDTTRSVLMMLGVLLHAADIHTVSGLWLVADADRHGGFDALVALIHSFRVPGFFLLSGLLLAGSLQRHSLGVLARRQVLRLGLPLLSCWLLLNHLQQWLLGGPLLDWAPLYQLWFLRDLLLLNLMLMAWLAWRRRAGPAGHLAQAHRHAAALGPQRLLSAWAQQAWLSHWLVICGAGALGAYALLMALRLSRLAYLDLPGDLTPFGMALYAPLFIAGLWLHRQPALLRAWLACPWWMLLPATALAYQGELLSRDALSVVERELALLLELLGIWCATGAAVGWLSRRPASRHPWMLKLARCSYTVFLTHHLVVVSLGLLLLPLPWPALLKCSLNASLSLLLCCALHLWVVERSRLALLLFNGRREPPEAGPRAG
jgi:glucan biosynthesis protein C